MHVPAPPAQEPRQRLVEAVIGEIERVGVARVTVRGIAAAAGMNIAAVNYHFRSKEALLAAAMEGSIRRLVDDCLDLLAAMAGAPELALTGLFGYLLDGAAEYPRVTRAHLHDAFVSEDYSGPFPTLFAPVVEQLRSRLSAAVPALDGPQAARRTVAALSAVFFPVFFPELFARLHGTDTGPARRAYCQELARTALAAPPGARSRRGRRR
jgi:TetR/AcrR family transcriptional regulator, regulator of cefoperazone and chloramphenicol sensitivity